ncbi:MAG: XRE family transcriptional regulator [Mycobacterium sp.]
MSELLRAVRQQRGFTLEALAESAGLTKSYLSKIERQQSTPSIAVAMKLARALDVDVAQLFSDDPEVTTLTVERANASSKRHQPLASSMLGKAMSPFLVRPTKQFEQHTHDVHPGQEFIFVHAGTVELMYDDDLLTLGTGDCVYFDAAAPHKIRQVGPQPSEVIVVTYNQPPRGR